jgi:hypothetical protein
LAVLWRSAENAPDAMASEPRWRSRPCLSSPGIEVRAQRNPDAPYESKSRARAESVGGDGEEGSNSRVAGKSTTERACVHFGWPLFRQPGFTSIEEEHRAIGKHIAITRW